jgi:hypothetical protein
MRAVKLHESHRQSLAGGLRLIGERLDRMEALLEELSITDATPSALDRIAEEERNGIREKVAELRRAVCEFAERFSIAPEEANIRQMLAGEVAGTWLILEGCRPRRLKNNGAEMDPSLNTALEDSVEELMIKILILRGMLR